LHTRSFVRYFRNDTNELESRCPFDSSFFVSQHSSLLSRRGEKTAMLSLHFYAAPTI
jgi:hypothetical protein